MSKQLDSTFPIALDLKTDFRFFHDFVGRWLARPLFMAVVVGFWGVMAMLLYGLMIEHYAGPMSSLGYVVFGAVMLWAAWHMLARVFDLPKPLQFWRQMIDVRFGPVPKWWWIFVGIPVLYSLPALLNILTIVDLAMRQLFVNDDVTPLPYQLLWALDYSSDGASAIQFLKLYAPILITVINTAFVVLWMGYRAASTPQQPKLSVLFLLYVVVLPFIYGVPPMLMGWPQLSF